MSRDGACCGAIAMLVDGDLYQFVFFCFLTNPMGAIFSNNEGSGVGALRIYFLLDLFMDLYHLKSHVIHGWRKIWDARFLPNDFSSLHMQQKLFTQDAGRPKCRLYFSRFEGSPQTKMNIYIYIYIYIYF